MAKQEEEKWVDCEKCKAKSLAGPGWSLCDQCNQISCALCAGYDRHGSRWYCNPCSQKLEKLFVAEGKKEYPKLLKLARKNKLPYRSLVVGEQDECSNCEKDPSEATYADCFSCGQLVCATCVVLSMEALPGRHFNCKSCLS